MEAINLDLFYNFRSHRARSCWDNVELILAEKFPDREAAEATAVKYVRTALSDSDSRGSVREIRIWAR